VFNGDGEYSTLFYRNRNGVVSEVEFTSIGVPFAKSIILILTSKLTVHCGMLLPPPPSPTLDGFCREAFLKMVFFSNKMPPVSVWESGEMPAEVHSRGCFLNQFTNLFISLPTAIITTADI
ncbi:unnamed protein product, partial [Hydatigera taeniaeformis]|uniref:Ig-like domain-containing protein n=1 Tax=Hydatigena taeniaeformis TaxID=6205 RepID=A0A0R3XB50_HYDTA